MKEIFTRIIQGTTLFIVGILLVTSINLFLEIQEFKEGNLIAELAAHEDEVIKLDNWRIINLVQQNEISPNQPLMMIVVAETKWDYFSNLEAKIEVFQSNEMIDSYDSTFTFRANQKRIIEFPFFLKNEGPQNLKIELLFRNETNNYVFEHRTRQVNDISVLSLRDKLLQEQNVMLFGTQIATIIATATFVGVTWYHMRKTSQHTEEQLKLTRRELESRLRAELEISVQKSDLKQIDDKKWEGMISILVRNNGSVSARNVKVHFKDPTSSLELSQLIRDEKEIKKTSFPIPGSISKNYYYPEQIIHKTPLEQSRVYDVAIWVTYDYGDVKNMELIQIIRVNAQHNSEGPVYEKEDIEKERERMKKRGLN